MTVKHVTLTGDLTRLVTAFAQPSDPSSDGPCHAMWESKPQIFLIDASGDAVRPRWPVTSCGFLKDGAADALSGLDEINSVDLTTEINLG